MRRIIRDYANYIDLNYPNHKKRIAIQLLADQNNYCAISEHYIRESGDEFQVAHFNPLLKNTLNDSCENWLGALGKRNKMMGTSNADNRWAKHQDILYPTSGDFNSRVLYNSEDGTFYHLDNDVEAENLISFLCLNDFKLVQDRKKYIANLRQAMDGRDSKNYFNELLITDPTRVYFIRAIEETFGIIIF